MRRQSSATTRAHGAELNSTVAGVQLGIIIRRRVSDLQKAAATMQLDQGNRATVDTITREVTSWRTLHPEGCLAPGHHSGGCH